MGDSCKILLMPRVFVFDAVHTLLRPMPDVVSAYYIAGKKAGSQLSKDKVKQRFRDARRKHFSTSVPASQTRPGSLSSSDEIEFQLWRDLIAEVFSDVSPVDHLFQSLWDHFADPANWQLYDDVAPCWKRLRAEGARILIASNFDSRLNEIVHKQDVIANADAVFCSAEVGFRKPDPKFYDVVAREFGLSDSDHVTMVGDDFENDCQAPRMFGWKALHLVRRSGIDLNSCTINGLDQLS